MHKLFLLIHRYTGIAMGLFLIVIATTGSIIAFHAELDRLLNPSLMKVPVRDTPMLDAVALRERAVAMEPRAGFEFMNTEVTPGQSFIIATWPKRDPVTGKPTIDPATDKPYALEHDQLFLDPYTGEKVGSRDSKRALMPFLFNLHYGMAFGNWGVWVYGIVSFVLTINCFIGLYLTFPSWRKGSWWRRWLPAWQIKLGAGLYRTCLDIHRAFGLWTWVVLLMLAWSGTLLNLPKVYLSVMGHLKLTPHGYAEGLTAAESPVINPALDWRAALDAGRVLVREVGVKQGFTVEGETFMKIDRYHGVYELDVRTSKAAPGSLMGDAGIFVDANTGLYRGFWSNANFDAGTSVSRWLVALHRGIVFGLPMQILICFMGFVTNALTITGLIIWLKKTKPPAKGKARPTKTDSAPAPEDPTSPPPVPES